MAVLVLALSPDSGDEVATVTATVVCNGDRVGVMGDPPDALDIFPFLENEMTSLAVVEN